MRINWITYLILTFGVFMVFIITLVVKTTYINVDLVSEDYYKQELNYQGQIDKMTVTKEASKEIDCTVDDSFLVLTFPEKTQFVKGEIEFYRPSNAKQDFKLKLGTDEQGKQYFKKELFKTGLYKMKIDWISKGINYYLEKDIYIQ